MGGKKIKKFVLISCVRKKLAHKAKAKDLYTSPLFRMSLEYAYTIRPDEIFILSAKYHLLELDREIAPYDVTLNDMTTAEKKLWASKTIKQLNKKTDLQKDHFVFLAGINYRTYLKPYMSSSEDGLMGLPIGKRLKYLKNKLGK